MKVSGRFEVKLAPLTAYATAREGMQLNRMSIDKTFFGELDASSQGEMLSAMTPVKGSAGYVAIEQVRGTLCGKAGSFVLQHSGTMNKGAQSLLLSVVPDSATGELEGLQGQMAIIIENGEHLYEFEFTLPESSGWV